jgi:tetratricopeptide (TPR) repeat protein
MDYLLWGLNPAGFRATNLILHLLNCFVLFSLAALFAKDRKVALFVSVLFSVHPVNTEAVSWISSRNNILVSLFCLSSLYCYVQGWRRQKVGLILISAILFAAGLLSKEFALMLLPMFFLYHRVFPEKERSFRAELAGYVPFLLVLAGYLALRILVIGSLAPPSDGTGLWKRIYFTPFLIMMNLRCVLFPSGLHSFILGYPESLFDWEPLAGFGTLALCGLFLWKNRKNGPIVFCGVSFLVALLPILNVIKTPAATLVSMRWIYFPTGFLLIALLCGLKGLSIKRPHIAMVIAGCAILYLGSYSFLLNKELWHSEDVFFRQEVVQYGNSYYLGGLAENLAEKGRRREAEIYFRKALEHLPKEVRNYINYSALLLDTGRAADAIDLLKRAPIRIMTRPERAEMQNNLGMAFFRLQRYDDAIESLTEAVRLAPKEPLFWSNLGAAHGATGDYKNSVLTLERGMMMASDPGPLKKNLAISYMNLQQFEKAVAILENMALKRSEEHETISDLLARAREGLSLRRGGITTQEEQEGNQN